LRYYRLGFCKISVALWRAKAPAPSAYIPRTVLGFAFIALAAGFITIVLSAINFQGVAGF
jgi:hypothetical protein